MAWRNIRPFPFHYAYGRHLLVHLGLEEWQRRRVWVDKFQDDHTRLATHPIWQLAPISQEIRNFALGRDGDATPKRRFVAWELMDDRHAEPFGLVYEFWRPERDYRDLVFARDLDAHVESPHGKMSWGLHVVAMTRDHVGAACLEKQGMSWIVDTIEGRHPDTQEPVSISIRGHGPVPDEDMAALEGLGGGRGLYGSGAA